jgi:hypothetical protein
VPSFRIGSSDIAKSDTPISFGPSIERDVCRKIQESRGFDTSELLVSKGSRRIRETLNCDGSHGGSVRY